MTMISRLFLPEAMKRQMYDLFYESLADLKSKQEIEQFLNDLLSPTERLMLSKRLAIALLLIKGYDFRSICQTVKVSQPTVAKVNFWLKEGGKGYEKVVRKILAQGKWQEFWQKLTDFIAEATDAKHKFPKRVHPARGSLGEEYSY